MQLVAPRRLAVSLLVLAGFSASALAVCLDPRDPKGARYYHPSLEQETKDSAAIVVARVVHAQPLADDKADPEGWTAFNYTLQVTEVLKGAVPSNITLRVANDSGGYRMQDDEVHLLFLFKGSEGLKVDACGNSVEMPKGRETMRRVQAIVGHQVTGRGDR
jgi:hypothetical protein